jgi:hypothetical protein
MVGFNIDLDVSDDDFASSWSPEISPSPTFQLRSHAFRPHDDNTDCSGECQPFTSLWTCLICHETPGHFIHLGCACKNQHVHYECMKEWNGSCPTCRTKVNPDGWSPARPDFESKAPTREIIGSCYWCKNPVFAHAVLQFTCCSTVIVHLRCAVKNCRDWSDICECVRVPFMDFKYHETRSCCDFRTPMSIELNKCKCTRCPCTCRPCCVTSRSILDMTD